MPPSKVYISGWLNMAISIYRTPIRQHEIAFINYVSVSSFSFCCIGRLYWVDGRFRHQPHHRWYYRRYWKRRLSLPHIARRSTPAAFLDDFFLCKCLAGYSLEHDYEIFFEFIAAANFPLLIYIATPLRHITLAIYEFTYFITIELLSDLLDTPLIATLRFRSISRRSLSFSAFTLFQFVRFEYMPY